MAYSGCLIEFKVITKQGDRLTGSLDSGSVDINAEAHEGDFSIPEETLKNSHIGDIIGIIFKWFYTALNDPVCTLDEPEDFICTYGRDGLKDNFGRMQKLKKDNIRKILVFSREVYWDEPWGAAFIQYDFELQQLKEEFRESDPAVDDCYGDVLHEKFKAEIDPSNENITDKQDSVETDGLGQAEKGLITLAGMEWRALCDNGDIRLVLSEKALTRRMPYNKQCKDVTWETCSLRKYLNGEFFTKSFSDEERSKVVKVKNTNPDNSEYGTPGGNNTEDKVFVLSLEEVNEYLPQKVDRKNGTYWWLRTPGENSRQALVIDDSGELMTDDEGWVEFNYCVRPAMWIKR